MQKEVAPGYNNQEQKPWLSRPMRDCLILSLSFMLVYTAYLAIQNLQSSLNQAEYLGVTSLSVLYGTIIICGTQAPLMIRLFGTKRVLLMAWIVHALYTASNFYPTWSTLVTSSALLGAIAGPMWTAQGIYITAAGERYATLHGMISEQALHTVLSRFNGIFFMCYEITQVTGNLISSLVLSTSSYNTTRNEDKICGAHQCDASSAASNATDAVEEPERNVVYLLLGIFIACNLAGLLLTSVGLRPLNGQRSESGQGCGDLFSCFKMLADTKILLLLPLFMAQAMAIGILYADYTKEFISCSIGVKWVGFIMASYGLCTAVFSGIINSLAHTFGRVILFIIAIVVDTATLIAMLVWAPSNESIAVFFLVPAVSGISEGIMQAQFNTLIAQSFKENRAPAFAVYHTSKAASFALTFALSTFMCLRHRLYLSIALYGLGFLGYITMESRQRRQKKTRMEVTEEGEKAIVNGDHYRVTDAS